MTVQVKDANGNILSMASKTHDKTGELIPYSARYPAGDVDSMLSNFAKDLADSDNENANKNYSVTPAKFTIAPPAGECWYVARVLVYIRDTGAFDADKYGNNITLTNGIALKTYRNGVEQNNLTNSQTVKANSHWGKYCYDTFLSTYGVGDQSLSARWTFTKAGVYIRLDGDENDSIEVELNDDFSGLVEHTFNFQGFKA